MICTNCKASLPDTARFCDQCGANVSPQVRAGVETDQDVETLKGQSVGVIDNRSDQKAGGGISSRQKIGTIEEGGTAVGAILGGEDSNVHFGGQQSYKRREVNTGGGTYVQGGVNTGGGDFVGRDKKVHGDEVRGDKIGGDNVTIGDVSNSTIAAGTGAQATSTQGIDAKELAALFGAIYERIERRVENLDADKDELTGTVQRIETEVAKGEDANPGKVQRWLKSLADVAPDILEVTVSSLVNPVAGVASAIRAVAQRVWNDKV